jgi:hypothetical protein
MLMLQDTETATEADPCIGRGALDDQEIVQLREWGSHRPLAERVKIASMLPATPLMQHESGAEG